MDDHRSAADARPLQHRRPASPYHHLTATPRTVSAAAGGSALPHERLRERKVESARHAQRRFSADVDRDVQSSPIRAGSVRGLEPRRPGSSGLSTTGKTMGVKSMEEVSSLHKQNFDLKLEVHHRRERQAALEKRLEEAEQKLIDQEELQHVNEELLAELEKRDQAVEEAVGIICNLENRIAKLNAGNEDELELPSSPPRLADRGVLRMPSFLSDRSESGGALRSLYVPDDYSDRGLPRLSEEDGMNSPRLSVLSESSFISVYGEKAIAEHVVEDRGHRKSSSIEKWVDSERSTPNRSPPRSGAFLSIASILDSPSKRYARLQQALRKQNDARYTLQPVQTGLLRSKNDMLPPTPDTISTSTLRRYQLSTDTLAAQNALASHHTLPRPRSAGETITSRREGHGWDTDTQADEASSMASSMDLPPRHRSEVPLFDFTTNVDDWDPAMKSTNPRSYPSAATLRQKALRDNRRRKSIEIEDEPRSNDTIKARSPRSLIPQRTPTPIIITQHPTPDRRSSLSAVTKTRRTGRDSQATPDPSIRRKATPVQDNILDNDYTLRSQENEGQRATPPPIRRDRYATWNHASSRRPMSSAGEERRRGINAVAARGGSTHSTPRRSGQQLTGLGFDGSSESAYPPVQLPMAGSEKRRKRMSFDFGLVGGHGSGGGGGASPILGGRARDGRGDAAATQDDPNDAVTSARRRWFGLGMGLGRKK